jgi:TRAP transporter 4TM/12TM fusion protein
MDKSDDTLQKLKQKVYPSRQRSLTGIPGILVTVASVIIFVWTFYIGLRGTPAPFLTRAIYLAFTIPVVFLLYPAFKGSSNKSPTVMDTIFSALSFIVLAWAAYSFERFQWRMVYVDPVAPWDLAAGIVAVLLVLEAVRRTVGILIVGLTIFFIIYSLTGPIWPGVFEHKGYDLPLYIEHVYLLPEGLFNVLVGIGATILFMFLAFGTFLQVAGGDEFFMNVATVTAGRRRGGPAKISVVASALMGMLSGSSVSNVVTTGSVTIPLMKRTGYRPEEAAAIETTASVGGGLTPPLMGAGVFLMIQFTNVPLTTILTYSICPAIIYFSSLYFAADVLARKHGLSGLPPEQIPSATKVILKGGHLALPLIFLVVLLVMNFTPFLAATVATLSLFLASLIRSETRVTPRRLIVAIEATLRVNLLLATLLAAAALIFGSISATGLIVKVTSIVLSLSGGSIALAILLVAGISYVLGMGLPITAAYVIVATLGASALNEMGLSLLAAHLIIFWLSQDSAITPPICITAFVAAGIAKASPMETGFRSMLIGKGLYIVPVMFAFGSLLSDSVPEIIMDTVVLMLAMFAFPIANTGYWLSKLKLPERFLAGISALLFLIAALGPMANGWPWVAAGLICFGAFHFIHRKIFTQSV